MATDYTEAEAGTKVHDPSEPLSLQVKGSTFWRASYSTRGGTSQVYQHILSMSFSSILFVRVDADWSGEQTKKNQNLGWHLRLIDIQERKAEDGVGFMKHNGAQVSPFLVHLHIKRNYAIIVMRCRMQSENLSTCTC
jgi:hypothetical protein